jgi:hypothetical protein
MMRGQIGGPLDELSEHKLPLKESADYPALPPKINGFCGKVGATELSACSGLIKKVPQGSGRLCGRDRFVGTLLSKRGALKYLFGRFL